MSDVLIPLGGAGGKNRGTVAVIGDNAPFSNAGAVMSLPLPAGNYKKSVSNPRTSYGDGKNSEVTISKELLKKMAIEAFGIASITNFRATMYAHKQVRLTWAKPTRGLWSGVHFIFKYGSVPDGIYDGTTFWDSADVHYETTRPLQEGLLYIRAYSYVETNQGRWYDYDGTPVYTTIQVTGISGAVSINAGAGTWTVPANVYKIRYILVGHGGRGGGSVSVVAAGGGGGGYFTTGYMDVTPGQSIPWVVPTVNSFVYNNGSGFNAGFNTKFGNISVECGRASNEYAKYETISEGGNGGSGGGGPYLNGDGEGASGGSNGSDGVQGSNIGGNKSYARGGIGQHTSTLGFNGVLYSGGGGGGGANGGAGGGANGWKYDKSQRFQNGADGTDGLGGGGGGGRGRNSGGGKGGTGSIYIAWGSLMNDGS